MEDGRHLPARLLHIHPVLDVLSGVVAEERPGREGVVHDVPGGILRCGCRLGADGCPDEHPVTPVEGLVDQRDSCGPPAPKDDGRDGNAFRILPLGIDGGTLACGNAESRVGMSCGSLPARLPVVLAHPGRDGHSFRDFLLQALPEDPAVARLGHVGEDRVLLDRLHGDGIRLVVGSFEKCLGSLARPWSIEIKRILTWTYSEESERIISI